MNIIQARQIKEALTAAEELRQRVAALEAAYNALVEQMNQPRKPGRPKKNETH